MSNIDDLKQIVKNRSGSGERHLTPEDRQQERDELAGEVERFLASGGVIQQFGQTKMVHPKPTYSISRKRWTD